MGLRSSLAEKGWRIAELTVIFGPFPGAEINSLKECMMTKERVVLSCLLGPALLCGGVLLAQKPAQNVSPKRHPNLAAAQRLSEQAFQRITAAQQANEWDMNGHAAKAKELLEQANNELRQAATAANRNPK
jgi:hypothetical protein